MTLERELSRLRSTPRKTQIGEEQPPAEAVAAISASASPRGAVQEPARVEGRPSADPWAKYGYGRSWREFADALDGSDDDGEAASEHVDTRPQAITRSERPAGPSLLETSRRMADSQSVEEIAATTLRYASERLQRCIMFVVKGDQAVGWAGLGEGISEEAVRRLSLPLPARDRESVFSVLQADSSHYLGPVPTIHGFQNLYRDLDVPRPRFLLLMPILVKGRTTAYLYGDCGDSVSLTMDVPSLLSLCRRAGMALQIIILRNKILNVQ